MTRFTLAAFISISFCFGEKIPFRFLKSVKTTTEISGLNNDLFLLTRTRAGTRART